MKGKDEILISDPASSLDPLKMINALPFAVFSCDNEFNIISSNAAFSRLFPASGESPLKCYQVLFGASRATPCSSCLMETARIHKKTASRELSLTINGKRKFLRMVTVPVLDSSGEVEFVYKYIEDVTARGLAEESISRYSTHLESLTENSTSSLKKNEQNLALISRSFHEINMSHDLETLTNEIANSFIKFRAFPVFFASYDNDAHKVTSVSMHPQSMSFPYKEHIIIDTAVENPFNIAARNRGFVIYHTEAEKKIFAETAFPGAESSFSSEMQKIVSGKSILILPIITEQAVQAIVALCVTEQHILEHFDTYRHLAKYSAMSLARQLSSLREQQAQKMAIMSLVKLMEYRDIETGLHLERLMKYTEILALELAHDERFFGDVTASFIKDLVSSCLLHDIGKVGIPDNILKKPAKLSFEEFEIMKQHTIYGGQSLLEAEQKVQGKSFLNMSKEIALYHHEWWDGSGYPYGLKGEDIPLCARITAIADVYDALRSKRPYKNPFTHDEACRIIKTENGTHFDSRITEAFFRCEDKLYQMSTMNRIV